MTTALHAAGPLHAPLLAALHEGSFPKSWSADAFSDLLRTPGTSALVAETDGKPSGFVLWRVAADEAEILTIAVATERRRQGLGDTLLKTAEAACLDAGARRVFLEVAADNRAAIALYRAVGYRDVGRRTGYYRTARGAVDAIQMARTLSRTPKEVT